MLVRADGSIVGTIGGGQLEHQVIAGALEVIATGTARRVHVHLTRDLGMCCGGEVEVYVEPLEVKHPCSVFGAGHVAHATVPLLTQLGFAVSVIDERQELATAERFPGADIQVVDDPADWAAELPEDPSQFILIVTHDHALDQRLVEALIGRPFAWLGLIGSRSKVAKFMIRLRAQGVPEAQLARLSAPVGLDIGAETPAEIAVSIAAEVVRVRRSCTRPPIPLSEQPIPARGGDGRARAPGLALTATDLADASE